MLARLKAFAHALGLAFWRGLLSPIADYVAAGVAALAVLSLLTLAIASPPPFYGTWGAWLAWPTVARLGRVLLALIGGLGALRFGARWLPGWGALPPRRVRPHPDAVQAAQAGEAWSALARTLAGQGLYLGRVRALGEDRSMAVARPLGAARLGSLADLGLALLAAGCIVQGLWGAVSPPASLMAGESDTLAVEPPLHVTLASVETRARADGASRLTRATLHIGERTFILRRGSRQRVERWSVILASADPALRLEAHSAAGEPLDLAPLISSAARGPVVRLRWEGDEQEQHVALPEANLVLRVTRLSARPATRFRVEALSGRDGRPLAQVESSGPATLAVQDIAISLAPEWVLSVRAERALGLPLSLLAGALCALGATCALASRPRAAWALVEPEGLAWRGSIFE